MNIEGQTSTSPCERRSLLLSGILRLTSSIRVEFSSALRLENQRDNRSQERIIVSAETCASRRAQETERPDALFRDIYAKFLAGDVIMKRLHGKNSSNRLAIRTKYFDDFVERNLNGSQPCQLVSLGAGMDMRPYRLECFTSLVSCYEVDIEEVISLKDERIASIQPAPRLRAGSIVRIGTSLLSKQWVDELLQAGFETKDVRTIWVMEGVVYYFKDDQVKELLLKIGTLCSPGSVFCASVLKTPPRNKRGPAFLSCIPDPDKYLQECGFHLIAADFCGGPAANYGRWKAERPGGTYYVSGMKPIV
ncbi:Leucine carboxyl methyltransferase [Gracilaria domingensis]|nr:Leucine carboxyl methyltransferase [Gracilaria domingensis]